MYRRGFLSVLLLGFVLGVLTTFAYIRIRQQIRRTHLAQTASPSPSLKTFTSTRANFSFNYPSYWPLAPEPDKELAADNAAFKIGDPNITSIENIDFSDTWYRNAGGPRIGNLQVTKYTNVKDISDYGNYLVQQYERLDPQFKKQQEKPELTFSRTIGGEKAFTLKQKINPALGGSFEPPVLQDYIFVHNGLVYRIGLDDSDTFEKNKDNYLKAFDQILSTFKFTQ